MLTLSDGKTQVTIRRLNWLDTQALEKITDPSEASLETLRRVILSPKLIVEGMPPAEPTEPPDDLHVLDVSNEDFIMILREASALGGAQASKFQDAERRRSSNARHARKALR
jgi:hypothetical protein